jgi:hypothetical protein
MVDTAHRRGCHHTSLSSTAMWALNSSRLLCTVLWACRDSGSYAYS